MEALSGTAIFWFISLGMVLGYIFGKFMKKEGISTGSNLIWGIVASIISGSIGIVFGMGDGLAFAIVGTLSFLFIVNVFHQHHEVDIFGDVDRGISLRKS